MSGYKNRFQNFIRYLREMGDEVNFPLSVVQYVIDHDCLRAEPFNFNLHHIKLNLVAS